MATKKKTSISGINLLRPDQIKEFLDNYVIGQEEAKKVLSVAVYNHYKKILYNSNNVKNEDSVEIDKSNIMLLGSTGCGKTLLVKTIARLLNVPCYIQDCTKITASGYVGSDVEECLVGLLRACDYDIERAQTGIIMLDEGDKIAKKDAGPSITRDVSGECVQQSLLKIVEGDVVGVPPAGGRKHPEQPLLYVDTTNVLFILSGAFVGLEEVIRKRMGSTSIGFKTSNNKSVTLTNEEYINYTTPQDVRQYGMIPEFVGRFPIITNVNKLSKDDLVTILKEPKNSLIKQYVELLKMDGIKLMFDDDALDKIAELTLTLETGARGLRTIIETIMTDIMYDAPKGDCKYLKDKNTIVITKEIVEEKTSSRYIGIKAA